MVNYDSELGVDRNSSFPQWRRILIKYRLGTIFFITFSQRRSVEHDLKSLRSISVLQIDVYLWFLSLLYVIGLQSLLTILIRKGLPNKVAKTASRLNLSEARHFESTHELCSCTICQNIHVWWRKRLEWLSERISTVFEKCQNSCDFLEQVGSKRSAELKSRLHRKIRDHSADLTAKSFIILWFLDCYVPCSLHCVFGWK